MRGQVPLPQWRGLVLPQLLWLEQALRLLLHGQELQRQRSPRRGVRLQRWQWLVLRRQPSRSQGAQQLQPLALLLSQLQQWV